MPAKMPLTAHSSNFEAGKTTNICKGPSNLLVYSFKYDWQKKFQKYQNQTF